jgi:hypothetical protein
MRVRTRRTLAAALIVIGALLMLFATETMGGLVLILAGVAVEIIGIALEHR